MIQSILNIYKVNNLVITCLSYIDVYILESNGTYKFVFFGNITSGEKINII